jgi:hypothetical protein
MEPLLPRLVALLLPKMRYTDAAAAALLADNNPTSLTDNSPTSLALDAAASGSMDEAAEHGEGVDDGGNGEGDEGLDEDIDGWNIRKCAASSLDLLATVSVTHYYVHVCCHLLCFGVARGSLKSVTFCCLTTRL